MKNRTGLFFDQTHAFLAWPECCIPPDFPVHDIQDLGYPSEIREGHGPCRSRIFPNRNGIYWFCSEVSHQRQFLSQRFTQWEQTNEALGWTQASQQGLETWGHGLLMWAAEYFKESQRNHVTLSTSQHLWLYFSHSDSIQINMSQNLNFLSTPWGVLEARGKS